jgi:hypothetical protein
VRVNGKPHLRKYWELWLCTYPIPGTTLEAHYHAYTAKDAYQQAQITAEQYLINQQTEVKHD